MMSAASFSPSAVRVTPRYFSYLSNPSIASRWVMFVTLACAISSVAAMSTARA